MATGIRSRMGTPAPSAKAQILEFPVLTRRGGSAFIPHLGPLTAEGIRPARQLFYIYHLVAKEDPSSAQLNEKSFNIGRQRTEHQWRIRLVPAIGLAPGGGCNEGSHTGHPSPSPASGLSPGRLAPVSGRSHWPQTGRCREEGARGGPHNKGKSGP